MNDNQEGAFPIASDLIGHGPGMTLRDYFAAKAMQALIRNYTNGEDFVAFIRQSMERSIEIPKLIAGMAYENADAMLAERAKQP